MSVSVCENYSLLQATGSSVLKLMWHPSSKQLSSKPILSQSIKLPMSLPISDFSTTFLFCYVWGPHVRLAMVQFGLGLGTFWLNLNLKYQVQSSRQLNPKPEPLKPGLKGSNSVWTSLNLPLNKPNFYFFYLFFLVFFHGVTLTEPNWPDQPHVHLYFFPAHPLLSLPLPYHFKNNVSHSFYIKLINFLI